MAHRQAEFVGEPGCCVNKTCIDRKMGPNSARNSNIKAKTLLAGILDCASVVGYFSFHAGALFWCRCSRSPLVAVERLATTLVRKASHTAKVVRRHEDFR